MISKQQKKEIITELTDKISRQKAIIFSDYTGLTVNKAQELRRKLRENNIDYKVAKKTLIELALKQADFSDVEIENLTGQVSATFGYDDEVLPAKILYDFSKSNENLKILAGLVNGEYIDNSKVVELAKLPSKQELLAQMVGNIASPISGLVNVLQDSMQKLVYILNNIK